jgi:glycosyltransferase involved in cell wall biosynthesis
MMRVLMIAPEPFFTPRGTPISILFRLKALSQLGKQVDLLTYHLGEDVHFPGVRIFRIPRVPLIRKIKVGPSFIKPLLDGLLFLKAVGMLSTGRYDVIHAHEEAAFFSLPLASLFGTRFIYDMHSSLPQQLSNYGVGNYRLLVQLFALLERYVVRRAGAIITICPDLQRHVEHLCGGENGFLIENTDVAPPPASVDLLVAQLRERFGLIGKLVIAYTGTFERNQGLDLLVQGAPEVLTEFPQAVYMLVGGRRDQLEELRAMAARQKVEERFLFPGSQSFEDVPVFLELADILVSPRSQGTNTPLKIYSYLASGKPIVATDMQTHRQVLDDRSAKLVPPTAEGLAQGIRELLQDAGLRERIGRRGRQLAEEHYNHRFYLARIREVFDHLNSPQADRSRAECRPASG